MIKIILTAPNQKLCEASREVDLEDEKTKNLLKDLKDTLLSTSDPEGAGLAAPQVGSSHRVFVIKKERNKVDFIINPVILKQSKETNFDMVPKDDLVQEGCLSVPGVYEYVKRPWQIKVQYFNERGALVKKVFQGLEAQVFCHEYDHLDGILFTERVLEQNPNAFFH